MASPEFKAAFVVNARDKIKHVEKAVAGALSQDFPCHIILSDQRSTDGTYEKMVDLANTLPRGAEHKVEVVHCPVEGAYSMATQNRHVDWLVDQTDAEWFFQCSADDYSLPRRVSECMKTVSKMPCASIVTAQWFTDPEGPFDKERYSHMPGGYIAAGGGLVNLVFGSCIAAYKRSFLKKIGPAPGSVTMDVWCGYQAALDEGYVVVTEPLHVHQEVADVKNMGFQGRMRWAEQRKDMTLLAQLNELNHFQLFELYYQCHLAQQKLYPLAHQNDVMAPINMMLGQATSWYKRRKELHEQGIAPGVM